MELIGWILFFNSFSIVCTVSLSLKTGMTAIKELCVLSQLSDISQVFQEINQFSPSGEKLSCNIAMCISTLKKAVTMVLFCGKDQWIEVWFLPALKLWPSALLYLGRNIIIPYTPLLVANNPPTLIYVKFAKKFS